MYKPTSDFPIEKSSEVINEPTQTSPQLISASGNTLKMSEKRRAMMTKDTKKSNALITRDGRGSTVPACFSMPSKAVLKSSETSRRKATPRRTSKPRSLLLRNSQILPRGAGLTSQMVLRTS